MIKVKVKSNNKIIDNWLQNILQTIDMSILDKYGKRGVESLKIYTPRDPADPENKTANGWYYTIEKGKNYIKLVFRNKNVTKIGYPIALILQYGHATKNGGWIDGKDYINPALKNVFEDLLNEIQTEVTTNG